MEIDGLRLLPPRFVEWRGRAASLAPQQWLMLAALVERRGEIVRYRELARASAINGDADRALVRNHVAQAWHALGRRLAALGCELEADTIHDQGRRLRGVTEARK